MMWKILDEVFTCSAEVVRNVTTRYVSDRDSAPVYSRATRDADIERLEHMSEGTTIKVYGFEVTRLTEKQEEYLDTLTNAQDILTKRKQAVLETGTVSPWVLLGDNDETVTFTGTTNGEFLGYALGVLASAMKDRAGTTAAISLLAQVAAHLGDTDDALNAIKEILRH